MTAIRSTFRSLRVRNFRLFFFGQLVSVCGTWMQTVALGWLVVHLTKSGTQLGLVIAVQTLPTLVGGAWAGAVADRVDKRKFLVMTQAAQGVVAGVLAVLVLTGAVRLWMVYAVALAAGFAVMFDNPTRQAFVTEMVGRDQLANAVGLNSAMFNAARVIGPAVAGVLILAVGTGVCFAVNAVSFIAVIASLLVMRPEELTRVPPQPRAKGQIRDGLRYALGEPVLRRSLFLIGSIGTFGMNFPVVLPLLARFTFAGNAGTYGVMTSAMGLGSLVSAMAVAARGRPSLRALAWTATAFGVCMLLCGVAPSLPVEVVLLGFTGMAAIGFMATGNALIQINSRPDMRGRVLALYMVLFLGSTPIGGPIMGWIAGTWGARWSLGIGGVFSLAAALYVVAVVSRERPGLIPSVRDAVAASR